MKRLLCWMFGHPGWTFLLYENGPKGWYYECTECTRCGLYRRELVASKLG